MNARETFFWATAVKNAVDDALDFVKADATAEMDQAGIAKAKVGPGYVVAVQKSRAEVADGEAFWRWMRENGHINERVAITTEYMTDEDYSELVAYVEARWPRAVVRAEEPAYDKRRAVEGPDGTCVDPETGEVIDGLVWERGTAYLKCCDAKNRKLGADVLRFNAPPAIRALLTGEAFSDIPEIEEGTDE